MSILFDTSILVAGFVASHPKHSQALEWLKRAKSKKFPWFVAAHSIAECYAVLTRLPLIPKLSPAIAKILIEENIEKSAKIIALSAKEYWSVIQSLAQLGLTGGITYDALVLHSAQKGKVKKILTFNVHDFQRLIPTQKDFIISP